ncbi:MAG TPA: heat-inducible transcriptional repressor HrcA [Syntrophomonadaceae bacterium]|nr:heat-inducible transcriptional repressor HrcA [Syntrophomonadaceae bacterium]
MTLADRTKAILESVIKDYIETAEPVGSRSVVKKYNLKISAATVRNEMADLEEMGYLEQPHTSSGRVPSQIGYRYFVDSLMEKENLTDEELELLKRIFSENINGWGEIVEKVGHFMAQLTNYTSFVVLPAVRIDEFKHLQIIPVGEDEAIVVIVTDLGLIMHRKLKIPVSVTPEELYSISQVFNKAFTNKNFRKINRTDLDYVRDNLRQKRNMIDKVINTIDHLLTDTNEDRVIISGALNMLNEPEFQDIDKLKSILTILKEDGILKDILPTNVTDEVDIKIGSENVAEEIKEMSIVMTGFKTLGQVGKIGVIGPVRMEYWKAAGTVESLGEIIEDLIKERF